MRSGPPWRDEWPSTGEPAFDLAEMVMQATIEVGEFFYEKHVPPDGSTTGLLRPLGRLMARASRIAEEVLVLLKAGYGQAALARWRAIDEVAVVGDFIAKHGDDCAKRYFEHEAIESWKAMKEFQEHAENLGETPYTSSQLEAAKQQHDALVDRYGPAFAGGYGWAHG